MLPRIAVLCVVSRSLVNSSALVPVSQCKTRCVHPRLSQASSGQRLVAGFLFVSNSLLFLQFSPQTQLQNKRRSSDRLHDTQTHYILTRNPNPAWVTGRAATGVSVPRQVWYRFSERKKKKQAIHVLTIMMWSKLFPRPHENSFDIYSFPQRRNGCYCCLLDRTLYWSSLCPRNHTRTKSSGASLWSLPDSFLFKKTGLLAMLKETVRVKQTPIRGREMIQMQQLSQCSTKLSGVSQRI